MRNNPRDQFEKVYLRYNTLAKNLKHADLKHMETTDYKRSINYIAYRHFAKRKEFYSYNGFDFDDIISISKTFSIAFIGLPENRGKDTISYKNMIRFIGQRLHDLVIFVERKFRSSDVVSIYSIHSPTRFRTESLQDEDDMDLNFGDYPSGSKTPEEICIERENEADRDSPDFIAGRIEDIESSIHSLESSDGDTESVSRARRKLNTENRKLKSKLKKMTVKKPEETFSKKDRREEVLNNKGKYLDSLCYYATSKHVDPKVRKAAIKMCKKMSIDHVAWVKNILLTKPEDVSHYTY